MVVRRSNDKQSISQAAAEQAAACLRQTIREKGSARIIAATGTSQFDFLEALTGLPGIDWKQVEMFHLDEYMQATECANPSCTVQ